MGKNVLLCTLGWTPKTVTQMFQALKFRGVSVDEIHLVGTAQSITVPKEYRDQADGVDWQEYRTQAEDIRSEEDAREVGNLIFQTLKGLKDRSDIDRLVLDLTGGRKEMSSYLMLSAQLLCSEEDRLYHVEVNDPKSPLKDTKNPYYYPKKEEEITLIDVPFVRLHALFEYMGQTQEDSLWDYVQKGRESLESLMLTGCMAVGGEHEIANLLGKTSGHASLKGKDYLQEINGIFRSFFAVVRPQKIQGLITPVSLQSVFEYLQRIFDDQVQLCWTSTPIQVLAERILLQRILRILIDNALKHGEASEICLHVAPFADHQMVEIVLKDNGRGMSFESQRDAFKLFKSYATKNGKQVGLPTVKTLIELLHGSVEIVSTNAEGTVIRLTLPRAREESG